MHNVYEIAPSMRVLIVLHNLCAINVKSAKKMEELKQVCCMNEEELYFAIRELLVHGYICECDGAYYLNSLGISVVRSVYT